MKFKKTVKMKSIVIVSITFFCFNLFSQAINFEKKENLTEEEKININKINNYYPEIKLTNYVTRYYKKENGETELIKSIFDFPQDENGFIYEAYIYYLFELFPNGTILYNTSAGRSSSSEGTINIMGNNVIINDFSFGTEAGTVSISVNGKQIFEETKEFE
jgi:hypothetical protein